ncbi:hypothetical protein K438DRAFT_1978051 [Mycena galopus ATCC 62051]|nr:hypothetical protein K438DRAFT_1978051 [Mycena galopus ATCC 62051]
MPINTNFVSAFWYKKHEFAMRISLRMTGTLPGGWKSFGVFLGQMAVQMVFVVLLFLPLFPFSATFLTPRERTITQIRLNHNHKLQSHGGMNR